ncbi:MAG: hypothetical protein V3T17_12220 [Pseudomonadales bacterium]
MANKSLELVGEFGIGANVKIRARNSKHRIIEFLHKKTHVSALLIWGENDTCWWPVSELKLVDEKQSDLFC